MSSLLPENRPAADRLLPGDEPVTGSEALARLQQELSAPGSVDLIVTRPEPRPIGRSWAFDWVHRRFVRPSGARQPSQTRGTETLKGWVEKCLQTARGAHPVHPRGYGLVGREDLFGGPVGFGPTDFEARVRDAVTQHPRIVDIADFSVGADSEDDEAEAVAFRLLLDDETELTVSTVLVANTAAL